MTYDYDEFITESDIMEMEYEYQEACAKKEACKKEACKKESKKVCEKCGKSIDQCTCKSVKESDDDIDYDDIDEATLEFM